MPDKIKKITDYLMPNTVDKGLLLELSKSFRKMGLRYSELEVLFEENLFTKSVIRKMLLLTSDFIKDTETEIPLSHVIIVRAFQKMKGQDKTTRYELDSDNNLISFTENIVDCTIKHFSLSITGSDINWNIEDGLRKKDLLFRYIPSENEKIKIEPYRINNLQDFQKMMYSYLIPTIYKLKKLKIIESDNTPETKTDFAFS